MKCKECAFLIKKESISLLSQMMGYAAECSKTGVLLGLEQIGCCPSWCPLREDDNTGTAQDNKTQA